MTRQYFGIGFLKGCTLALLKSVLRGRSTIHSSQRAHCSSLRDRPPTAAFAQVPFNMPRVIELQAPLDDKSSPLDNVKAVEHKQQGVDEPSEAEVHRIIRKVDSRLIVIYGFMVAISLLDRANLSNANIAGYFRHPGTLENSMLTWGTLECPKTWNSERDLVMWVSPSRVRCCH